jgi:Bacterial Ig-like domain (group 2)
MSVAAADENIRTFPEVLNQQAPEHIGQCVKTPNETAVLKPLTTPSFLTRRQIMRSGIALAAATSLEGWGSVTSTGSSSSSSGAVANPQLLPAGPMTVASLAVTTQAAGSIGPAFAGLSYEKKAVQWSFFQPSNVVGISLFQALGPSLLRIGGSSVDQFVWTPNGAGRTYLQVAPSDVDALAAFVKAAGWQCLYGINLGGAATGATTPALAAEEVAYAVEQFGSSLYGIEIGNEPDAYGAPGKYYVGNWSLAQYLTLWGQFRDAIVATTPGVPITGPAASYNVSTWTIPYGQAVAPSGEITLLTQHYYRANGQAPTSTAAFLVTPDTTLVAELAILKAGSKSTGVPYRIAECNSFYAGGASGVSNSYASSLWVIDFLFNCAQGGAVGVNLHGGGNSPGYTPIADWNGIIQSVRPEYYGILFFTLACTGTLYATQLSAGSLNVTAYAVQAPSGNLNLVIVNKDPIQNLQLAVQLPQPAQSATLLEMNQLSEGAVMPELVATDGVTIQGSPVNLGSPFSAGAAYTLSANGSQLNCYVPGLSAVLIQVVPVPPGPTLISVYLQGKQGAATIVLGGTLQFTAYGNYSDGSVATLPDASGNAVTLWNTSNHTIAKISAQGHATALSLGTVYIEATVGAIIASPCQVTVIAGQ